MKSQNRRNTGKRTHVETGNTPGKPPQKSTSGRSSRKSLFTETGNKDKEHQPTKPAPWSDGELKELVKYVALYSFDHTWPTHKNKYFWEQCGKAVSQATKNKWVRSGNACRDKVIRLLRQKYKNIQEAEDAFNIDYMNDVEAQETNSPCKHLQDEDPRPGQIIELIKSSYLKLTKRQRLTLMQLMFEIFLKEDIELVAVKSFVSSNFLELCGQAMKNLEDSGKENVILHLAKCLQKNGSETRMPLNQMPFGMIAYNCKFFASESSGNIKIPEDYMSWMTTMYTHFGNQWATLHLGPHWCHDELLQEKVESTVKDSSVKSPTPIDNDIVATALALEEIDLTTECPSGNPPSCHDNTSLDDSKSTSAPLALEEIDGTAECPVGNHDNTSLDSRKSSESVTVSPVSTLWSGLTNSDIAELQEAQISHRELEERFEVRPQGKSSGGSIKKDPLTAKVNIAGPSTSTIRRRIASSGFTRSTDIQLQALKMAHESNKKGRWWIKADATDMQKGLRESMKKEWSGDVDLGDGIVQRQHEEYLSRLGMVQKLGKGTRKSMLAEDLNSVKERLKEEVHFLEKGKDTAQNCYDMKRTMKNASEDSLFALAWEVDGYEKLLTKNAHILSVIEEILHNKGKGKKLFFIKEELEVYIKGIYTKKRDVATHLLIFMISDELRNRKPYAIPVRILTYHTITDARLRELKDELKDVMEKMGMVVVGFSTDGEFNSLRTQGSTRPTSVVQLAMDAKAEAKSTKAATIKQYLTPINVNGNIAPQRYHPAVPMEDVQWLWEFMNDPRCPCSFNSAIHILRRKHYPFSHDPNPWIVGKQETTADCLKSLMASYIYRHKVSVYSSTGVDFKNHLYVPDGCHDREDHNHILKRIGMCTRNGLVPSVDLRWFVQALKDPATGLTYTALTGQRKQNVPDVERIFSPAMVHYMNNNGHHTEATYLKTVCNWHKANDGRGLTEDKRCQYNYDMLRFVLDDWMPWHTYDRDFSKIDINRPLKGICGFTREIIVGLIANIESRELRRLQCHISNLPPEHPRASSTDDVEGFISILHRLLGKTFDHKTFMDNYPKIVYEFTKKIDPDLPFFYWSGSDTRYNVGPLPSFNKPSASGLERLDTVKISRRADPAVFAASRASLPQRGSLTIRATFHNPPECLPPPNMNH